MKSSALRFRGGFLAAMLLTLATLVLLTGCTGLQLLNAVSSHAAYHRVNDIPYGTETRQTLDVYSPVKGEGNAKVVVFFYGGSWRHGQKADYRFVGQALASRGFVAVLPDYRLYPEVTFPKFVEDGARATRWTRDHIKAYGGNPAKIYLMGHSAGAHIAALLTLDAHYLDSVGLSQKAIRATAALSGPYDFIPNQRDRAVFGLATNTDAINPAIEPINFVNGREPPMLLIQGLRDKTVAPSNAVDLAARIRAADGEVECRFYPRRGHASVIVAVASPFHWLAPTLKDVIGFFDAH